MRLCTCPERERQIIFNCFIEIQEELERAIDKHSKDIIASTIELLLNHCQRFYDRQFITRENINKDILVRLKTCSVITLNQTSKLSGFAIRTICRRPVHLSLMSISEI